MKSTSRQILRWTVIGPLFGAIATTQLTYRAAGAFGMHRVLGYIAYPIWIFVESKVLRGLLLMESAAAAVPAMAMGLNSTISMLALEQWVIGRQRSPGDFSHPMQMATRV